MTDRKQLTPEQAQETARQLHLRAFLILHPFVAGDLELEIKTPDEQLTEKGRMVAEATLATLTDLLEEAVELDDVPGWGPTPIHDVRIALEIYVSSLTGALSGSHDVRPGWAITSLARTGEVRWEDSWESGLHLAGA